MQHLLFHYLIFIAEIWRLLKQLIFRYLKSLVVASILICSVADADEFATYEVSSDTDIMNLDTYYYLKNYNEKLKPWKVLEQGQWTQNRSSSLPVSATEDWVYFKIKNISKKNIDWYLWSISGFRSLDIWIIEDGDLQSSLRGGLIHRSDPKKFRGVLESMQISLPVNKTSTVLIRYGASSVVSARIYLGSFRDLTHFSRVNLALTFLFIGAVLAICFYNFMLGSFLNKKAYILYTCYGFCAILAAFGHSFDAGNRLFLTMGSLIAVSGVPIFFILFFIEVFDCRKKFPITSQIANFILVYLGLQTLLLLKIFFQ